LRKFYFQIRLLSGGITVASQNFVLEFGMHHERPMLIAISDTASHLMMAIGPLLGGLIAQRFDFSYVFGIAIVVKAFSMLAILRVDEPRHRVRRMYGEGE
jgi:MFS family permease